MAGDKIQIGDALTSGKIYKSGVDRPWITKAFENIQTFTLAECGVYSIQEGQD